MGSEQRTGTFPMLENVATWQNLMFLYESAIKEVRTKLDILSEEFQNNYRYNPIEYVKSRIKTPENIVKKMRRNDYEITMENMVEKINDVAGVRIVCDFTADIYRLVRMIRNLKEFEVIREKDYIAKPKDSGYRSYHLIVKVPVYTTTEVVKTKVEIQIRTIAMDFWATLEHKIYYKFEGNAPDYISKDLRTCADIVAQLDDKMLSLNDAVMRASDRLDNSVIED
ncbi:MAG: GTP pyrophosphokinase family protein [Eubacterium sp.]|nr:GTP pyrophosphokinase family protein [Eubacterium sp.]